MDVVLKVKVSLTVVIEINTYPVTNLSLHYDLLSFVKFKVGCLSFPEI